MIPRNLKLFDLFGSRVSLDLYALPLGVLAYWTCADGIFPFFVPGLPPASYQWMGIAGTCGLFLSVLARELAQILIAHRLALPLPGVALLPFGGTLEAPSPVSGPRREFLLFATGGAASFILGSVLLLSLFAFVDAGDLLAMGGTVFFLGLANGTLLLVNVFPVYPLVGGRVTTAILARRLGPASGARFAAGAGSWLAAGLMLFGVWLIVQGDFAPGVWVLLLGLILYDGAARHFKTARP